ncbi:hypothetical protein [Lentilactobacillus kosonis]|uniref:Helix-turn-helix type 11 domain-containing protein n=1 Tax=Lentilactobacillus kosonis TaxID=2810561 RepID=A0A401FJA9_9LACO|nr:hypothetical protein [Lentilactobacillus kosonis]GAY72439.1 hypothetical protein NBRC111893_585 [Lentilactobacillus kosonis]
MHELIKRKLKSLERIDKNESNDKKDAAVLWKLAAVKPNKVARKDLLKISGLSDRDLYTSIESLRQLGVPIMASRTVGNSGYYIATTPEMLSHGVSQYRQQIQTQQHNLQLLEKSSVNHWLQNISNDRSVWGALGSDLFDVQPTADGAKISVKKVL